MSGIVSSHSDFANSAKGTSNSKGRIRVPLIGTHSQQTTSRKAFQREHQEKDKGRVPMGVGREEPAVEKGRVPEQGRVPPLGWARGLQGAQDADKTMKKGPSIGKGQGQDDADTRPQRHPAHLSHLCGGLLTGSGQ